MSKSESKSEPLSSLDVLEPPEDVTNEVEPTFGWNAYAEVINGRVAMLAVVSLLVLEWLTKQDLLTWLGVW